MSVELKNKNNDKDIEYDKDIESNKDINYDKDKDINYDKDKESNKDNIKINITEPVDKNIQSQLNKQTKSLQEPSTKMNNIKINNISQEFGIMITLQENLNLRIGRERWKKYISTMFWYYVTMPINFTITLFTALSSGQVGTNADFLSETTLFAILFTSFLLSTINTFFKLKETTEANYQISQQFEQFAIQFQDIYFTPIKSNEDVYSRLTKYKKLQYDINEYCMQTKLDHINYLTEIIYSCCKAMCFRSRDKLINISERFWILDGKKKCDTYNKKCLIVDTSNFLLDIENIAENDMNKLSIKELLSPDYVPTHNEINNNIFRNIFNRNHTNPSSLSSDSSSTQTDVSINNNINNNHNNHNNNKISKWQRENMNLVITDKNTVDNISIKTTDNMIMLSNRLEDMSNSVNNTKISINV